MKTELGSPKRTSQGTNPTTPRVALDENDIALAKHISDSMGFNILDLHEGAITLASKHRALLERMPTELVEDLDPGPGVPIPGVERVADVYGLFLPLLMEVFLRLEDPTIIRPAAGGLDGYGQWVPEWVDTESDPNVDLSAEPDPLGPEGRVVGGGAATSRVPVSTMASGSPGSNPEGEPLWESLEETLDRINKEIETVPDLFETHIANEDGGGRIW